MDFLPGALDFNMDGISQRRVGWVGVLCMRVGEGEGVINASCFTLYTLCI